MLKLHFSYLSLFIVDLLKISQIWTDKKKYKFPTAVYCKSGV